MSWDIVLFKSRQKIKLIEEMDDTQLEPTDFCTVFESYFTEISKNDDHREVKGRDFTISYFIDEDKVSNKMLTLYGENGLFELVELARKHNWQIYDTGSGQMIDLEDPANNGYGNFQSYLRYVLKK